MLLARVTAAVVSTVKDEGLRAHKLLVVRLLDRAGRPLPRTLVALDTVGAGAGELVYICRGKEASFAFATAGVPTDAAIVGIVDPSANGLPAAGTEPLP